MSYKTFCAGAVTGAAITATLGWLVIGTDYSPADDTQGAAASSESSSSVITRESSNARLPEESVPSSTAAAATDRGVAPTTGNERPAIRNEDDTQADEPGDNIARDTSYWLDKQREELRAEPKDDSWAYYMEQTITQFLSGHSAIVEFEVSYVECRTTICQIQVIGFDDSTAPTWSRIMYDLRLVLPEQMQEWGMSAYDLEGRHAIVQTIRRL